MRTHSVCQFVMASSVREDIVRLLSNQPQSTPTLIDQLDACRSGVYKELSNLSERGALTEAENGWKLTACGQLVTDTITQRQATEAFLGHDMAFWQRHDIDLLPERFRQQLPTIDEYEIIRGGMPAVNEHVSELLSRVAASDSCNLLTPVFVPGLGDAIPDRSDSRILVTSEVWDRLREAEGKVKRCDKAFLNARVRLVDADFTVTCTDDALCLVFPSRAGGEWQATLVSETPSAIQWGRDLFDSLWHEAEPVDKSKNNSRIMSGRSGMVGTSPPEDIPKPPYNKK